MMMVHGFMPTAGLGILGHVLFVSGVVLLLAWAIKHLHGDKLRQAGLWCIVIGLAVCVISISLGMLMVPKSGKMLMWKAGMQDEAGMMMQRQ